MSEQKRSIDNFEGDKTNTNEVKGGFGPNHAKASQNREATGDKLNPKPIIDPKKPIRGHGDKQSRRSFEK